MQAGVVGELGMKGDSNHWALLHPHDPTVVEPRQHVDVRPDRGNDWRTNEDGMEWLVPNGGQLQLSLKAVHLPAKRVATHVDVQCVQTGKRFPFDSLGENDHAGTGAENR